MHHRDVGDAHDTRDRRNVLEEIEAELVVERRVDGIGRIDQQECIPVGGRAHDGLGGEIVSGAGPVLDNDWLAELFRQLLADQARHEVGRAAWRIADNPANGSCRVGLRPHDPRV